MKRFSVVLMILTFFILIACGGSENTSTSDDSSNPSNDPVADHVSTLLAAVDSSAPAETVKYVSFTTARVRPGSAPPAVGWAPR